MMVHIAVDLDVVEGILELGAKVVAKLLLAGGFGGHLVLADLARCAETDDAGHV